MTSHEDIVNALLMDSYKITMAYSFYKAGRHEAPTAYELFFRKCPFGGEYVVFAGLKEAMGYIAKFKFTEEQIKFIREKVLPADADDGFFKYLSELDCSKVDIRAMPEGSLCFPREPLIVLEGPQVICELVETAIINLVSFPSLIATNASRMRQIVGNGSKLVEFGLRRAQGPDGGLSASQYSYLGGFDGSSNLVAGFKYDIPISGTVAHSFVTSFTEMADVEGIVLNGINIKDKASEYLKQMNINTNMGELAAFIAYGQALPTNFLCLVDTYHTLKSGVPNFIAVAFALQDAGYQPKGIRLDSGDLAKLSIAAKEQFKFYGQQFNKDTSKFYVVASNDINEESLLQFTQFGHSIDVFGIGTNIVTCQKQPALGLVYKLIESKGKAVMKLSEEPAKSTWPGKKNLYRVSMNSGRTVDLVTSFEYLPDKEVLAIDPYNLKRYTLTPTFVENLLQPVDYLLDLHQAKKNCAKQLNDFDKNVTRLVKPSAHLVLMSMEYYMMVREKQDELSLSERIE